ncbi:unnamed protein product [Nesidiocoris tenuis]|uniref:HEAT repeat-containing protein 1 n=1 Tax=Nesidiocoris tenuis TaxID=355587 RepID=A0A6H5HZ65_9HEMI|nr:unnamed protein product [Nesidiocoris tenuis]
MFQINALLPTDLFLMVIKDLLNSEAEVIRRKAMELLGWRLQDPRRPVIQETLFTLLGPFTSILDSIVDDPGTSTMTQERQLTLQTALFTLKLMARQLATSYVAEFKQILAKVVALVTEGNVTNWAVLGSLALCAGELFALLKSSVLSVLPQFVPTLIDLLKSQFNVDEGQKLSSEVPSRVLVPAAASSFAKFVKKGNHSAIPPLMAVLSSSLVSSADLTPELSSFFLKALQFRSDHSDLDLHEVSEVESSVIASILTLSLKLSEAGFRPMYSKFFEWAHRGNQPERLITFYSQVIDAHLIAHYTHSLRRLSLKLGEALKNLFNLFAGLFIENASELLQLTNLNVEPGGYFQGDQATTKTCLLVDSILASLHVVFLHDSHNFVNKERFACLMKPLVDQVGY